MASMMSRVGLVSALTMVSRFTGLARDILTTAIFGTSVLHSAFNTAFTLPNLFRRLLGEGALTAALMPNLSEELEKGGRPAVFVLVNKTLTWLAAVCVLLVVVATIGFLLIEHASSSERWILGARLAKWLFPYVALICLAAVFAAALNLLGRFGVPALTAVWLNASILISLGLLGWLYGETAAEKLYWLVGGALFGGMLQLLAPAVAFWREGWRPNIDFALSPSLRSVLWLTLPGTLGAASHQINLLVTRGLAFDFSDAGATQLYIANRLVELPLGVFTIAIATVIFPVLSQAAAMKDSASFERHYRNGIVLSTALAIPAALGLALLAPEIIATLYQRGAFEAADTKALAPVLIIFACGMPFYSFVSVETRAFYSMKDTRTPVLASTAAMVINVVLSIVLLRTMQRIEALAISSNATIVAQAFFLHWRLRRQGTSIRLRHSLGDFLKVLLSSLAMAAVILLARPLLPDGAVVAVAVLVPLGALAFLGAAKLLRLSALDMAMSRLQRSAKKG